MSSIVRRIQTLKDIELYLPQLIEADPSLAPIKQTAGPLPLRLSSPDFSGLAEIVVSQHVSKQSAAAIMKRLVKSVNPLNARHFNEANDELLVEVGLTRAKQQALQDVANSILAGDLDLTSICELDQEESLARLTAFKGIGPWTAEVFLLFCGGHVDIFPAGDVALRTAIGDAFNIEPRPSEPEARKISNRWAPLRGIAARLFWAYYAARKKPTAAT